jgi:two-component system, cell cycle response regulator DivK
MNPLENIAVSSQRVLVVDDLEEQRDIYTSILRHHGYTVLEATSGDEAIRQAREGLPDVILLDIMLAGTDGIAVADHLKADPATAHIPIVALTVLGSPEDESRALEAGVENYLVKPCLPADILAEVRRLIGEPETPR